MLRGIVMKNFIHFRDREELIFHDGANFITGANSSGKSSIFELIRRCLAHGRNTSTSRIFDKSESAYAVCKYKIPSTNEIPLQEITGLVGFQPTEIFTATLAKCLLDEKIENHLKVLSLKGDQNNFVSFCNSFTIAEGPSSLHNVPCTAQKASEKNGNKLVWDILENLYEKEQDVIPLNIISDKFEPFDGRQCEDILEVLSGKYVVLTFPMRSIGPLQWSLSKKIRNQNCDRNYREARERAEILEALLPEADQVDPEEEEAFNKIVEPSVYQIRKRDVDMDTPLLKLPEGVIETKQLTLMLFHKDFQTLCLEEPDRGMHSRMIEKIRELVLRKIRNKVVIIISHHPSIMSHWSIQRSFICQRKRSKSREEIHHVAKLKELNEKHFLASDDVKKILYASNVLVVEGPSDKLLIESILEHILDGHTKVKELVGDDDMKQLQSFVSLIEIIVQNANKNESKIREICKCLNISCYVLSDLDTHAEKNEEGKFLINASNIYKILDQSKAEKFMKCLQNVEKRKVQTTRILFKHLSKSEVGLFKQKIRELFEDLFEIGTAIFDDPHQEELVQTTMEFCRNAVTTLTSGLSATKTEDVANCFIDYFHLFNRKVFKGIKKHTRDRYTLTADAELKQLNINLENDNSFIWNSGSLEDVVNDAILCKECSDVSERINLASKHWLADNGNFPILKDQTKDKNKFKDSKRRLLNVTYEVATSLSQFMLDVDDVKLFIGFLSRMSKKS